MELMFITLLGAIMGLAARYLLPHRHTHGVVLMPAIGVIASAVLWETFTWLGFKWDAGVIWWIAILGTAVVLVAADGPELRPKVERFLERYALDSLETWQFGDDAEERLRYAVDHTWRGELPRAYFFSATGETSVKSGVPEESWLTDWFKQANAVAAPPAP